MINVGQETYPQLAEIFFSYKNRALKPLVDHFLYCFLASNVNNLLWKSLVPE